MRYRFKQRTFQGSISEVGETRKEMFNILGHQKNANQNYFEISILHLAEWLSSITEVKAHACEEVEQGE